MPGYYDAYRASRTLDAEPRGSSPAADRRPSDDIARPAELRPESSDNADAPSPSAPAKAPAKTIQVKKRAEKGLSETAKAGIDKKSEPKPGAARDRIMQWRAISEEDAQGQDAEATAIKGGGVKQDVAKSRREKDYPNRRAGSGCAKDSDNKLGESEEALDKPSDLPDQHAAAGIPKRRVVSDEHWKNVRSNPQAPQVTTKKSPVPADQSLFKRPGSKRAEGWVRRRSTPGKLPKTIDENGAGEAKETGNQDANGNNKADSSPEKARLVPEKNTNDKSGAPKVAEKPNPVGAEQHQNDQVVDSAKEKQARKEATTKEIPKSAPAKLRKGLFDRRPANVNSSAPPFKIDDSGKNKNATSRGKEDESATADPEASQDGPGQEPFANRMDAWLSQTPDPFVEGAEWTGVPLPDSSASISHSRSSRRSGGQNRTGQREEGTLHSLSSPVQSDSDALSTPSSPTLKRTGAKRRTGSPTPHLATEEPLRDREKVSEPKMGTRIKSSSSKNEKPHDNNRGSTKMKDAERKTSGGRKASSSKKPEGSRPDLKRRLTSHADLMSVLSMGQEESNDILPARSVRTCRTSLTNATIPSILDEIRTDEMKYTRELRTLVDGVIPVLLKYALSKSTSPEGTPFDDVNDRTKLKDTIIDLGVTLERLQGVHHQMPMYNADELVRWVNQAHGIYVDYIKVWKLGFEDVVVTLAPSDTSETTSRSDKGGVASQNKPEGEPQDGGERVDVAFLLKRPLVRLKYLAKALKGIDQIQSSAESKLWATKYQDLTEDARKKSDKERARLEDEAAAKIDATRARDPENLAPLRDVRITRGRNVRARDIFQMKMHHSNGQRLDCQVMLLLRDDSSGGEKNGDVLICETESSSKWLLFPPIQLTQISSCHGKSAGELIVMLRGNSSKGQEWRETLCLTSGSQETAVEWVDMLGSYPLPPESMANTNGSDRNKNLVLATPPGSQPLSSSEVDIPIGEQSTISCRPWTSSEQDMEMPLRNNFQRHEPESPLRGITSNRQSSGRSDEHCRGDGTINIRRHRADISPEKSFSALSTADSRYGWQEANDFQGPMLPAPSHPSSKRHSHQPDLSRSRDVEEDKHLLLRRLSTIPSESSPTTNRDYVKRHDVDSNSRNAYRSEQGQIRDQTAGSEKHMSMDVVSRWMQSQTADGTEHSGAAQRTGPPVLYYNTPQSSPNVCRRSSSPLKKEYRPDSASDASSLRGGMGSDDEGSVTSESSIEDMVPDPDFPIEVLKQKGGSKTPGAAFSPGSPATLSPSHSASQAAYRTVPRQESSVNKVIASIYSWSDKGYWDTLHPDECSIVVSPGLIEAFKMSAAHSAPVNPQENSRRPLPGAEKPLVALELTPLVPLRQGTAIDISIRSPPTKDSQIQSGNNIMFRSRTGPECEYLYSLINQARINNPTYIALQNARGPFGASNWASYMDKQASIRNPSSWWRFGSKKSSYRAGKTRHTFSVQETLSSVASRSSALSALKRFTAGSKMFNVANSTVSSRAGLNHARSNSTHSSSSRSSQYRPRNWDPSMGSPAGTTDMRIRVYERETASKWRDMGSARLTIMHPPRDHPGAAAISPTGHLKQEKRIVIIGRTKGETILDATLGETSFERVARTGIAVKVWERWDEMAKTGGVVTARVRVYMIQMKSEAEAAHTFSLVGRPRY